MLGVFPLVSRKERFRHVQVDCQVYDNVVRGRNDNDARPEDGTGKNLIDCSDVTRFYDYLDQLLQERRDDAQ